MRKILSPLFSLFTVVGGHFVNRRLDIGLLFFALLLLVGLASSFLMPLLFAVFGSDAPVVVDAAITRVAYVLTAIMIILLLSSVIVSYIKAKEASTQPPIGKTGVVASLLAVLLSLLIVVWIGVLDLNYLKFTSWESEDTESQVDQGASSDRSFRFFPNFFHEAVRYGGRWVSLDKLERMPEGEAFLAGRISYAGEPAVGVALKMAIDSRYRSDQITTDENGLFILNVPAGEWMLNRIEIEGWPDRPPRKSFTIIGGPNPLLAEAMYDEGPSFESEGVAFKATKEPVPLPGLGLVIQPNVEMHWPVTEKQTANRDTNRISWDAFETADQYQVQLHRVTRDGSTTSYRPVAWINTTDTEVPLTRFKTLRDEREEDNEYSVRVYAFDSEGKLLSSSSSFFGDRSIVLNGQLIVETDELRSMGDISSLPIDELDEQIEARFRDKRRLAAARTLVDEDLLDSAKVLLDRVESTALDEEKLTLSGMILASEGRCDEARVLLDRVNDEHDRDCYPDIFTERCQQKPLTEIYSGQ